MERRGDEVQIQTNEARSGTTPHIVRYVLAISLFLAIAALTVIWVTGAATSDQPNRNGPISGQATPHPR